MMSKKLIHLVVLIAITVLVGVTTTLAQDSTEVPRIFSEADASSSGLHVWSLFVGETGYTLEDSYQPSESSSSLIFWVKVSYVLDERTLGEFIGIYGDEANPAFVFQHYYVQPGPVFNMAETLFWDEGCWVHDGTAVDIAENGCDGVVATYSRPAGQ